MRGPTRSLRAACVLVAALAAGVALWPSSWWPSSPEPSQRERGASSSRESDLAAAQMKAQLSPCPQPEDSRPTAGSLRGVVLTCLGDSSSVDLGAALAGRTTLINVWATWCAPCRDELPVLDRYAQEAGSESVLGLQVQSSPVSGVRLLAELRVRLPSVTDDAGQASRVLTLPRYLPASFIVLPDGSVCPVQPPMVFRTTDEVATAIDRYRGGCETP